MSLSLENQVAGSCTGAESQFVGPVCDLFDVLAVLGQRALHERQAGITKSISDLIAIIYRRHKILLRSRTHRSDVVASATFPPANGSGIIEFDQRHLE